MIPRRSRFRHQDKGFQRLLPVLKKVIGWSIVGEIALAGGLFVGFRQMNNSPDTRRYLYRSWPAVLEGYYYVSDTWAGNNIREQDLATWALSESEWKEDGN